MRGNGAGSLFDITEIGLMIQVERSWHADDYCIHLSDFSIGAGGAKAGSLGLYDFTAGDANNVGAPGIEGLYFTRVNIKACDAKALLAEKKRQRQADVPHAYDADLGPAGGNTGFEFRERRCGKRHETSSIVQTCNANPSKKGAKE